MCSQLIVPLRRQSFGLFKKNSTLQIATPDRSTVTGAIGMYECSLAMAT